MAMCPNDWELFPQNSTASKEILQTLMHFGMAYGRQHGYICMVLCSFGIITNILHIIILTRPTMRNSAVNVLLVAVAACDSLTMTTYLLYIMRFVVIRDVCSFSTFYWMTFLNFHSIFSIYLHSTSLWLAVGMAFVRRMTLKQARLYSRWQSAKYAVKICILTYLCVMVLWIPTMLSQQVIEVRSYCPSNFTNVSYTLDMADIAKKDNCFLYKVNLWVTGIVYKLIPCLLLGWLSVGLLALLRRAEKKRCLLITTAYAPDQGNSSVPRTGVTQHQQTHSKARNRTDRTTTMLIVILLVFLITELPQGALAILNAIYTSSVNMYIYPAFADLLDLLSLINSSVNFLLYCVMSSRYRATFWKVILPKCIHARYMAHVNKAAAGGCESQAQTYNLDRNRTASTPNLSDPSQNNTMKHTKMRISKMMKSQTTYSPSIIPEISEESSRGSLSSSRRGNYSTNENLQLSSFETGDALTPLSANGAISGLAGSHVAAKHLADINNTASGEEGTPTRKSRTFSGRLLLNNNNKTSPHVSPAKKKPALTKRMSHPFMHIGSPTNLLQTPSIASLRSTPSYPAEMSENCHLLSFADSSLGVSGSFSLASHQEDDVEL